MLTRLRVWLSFFANPDALSLLTLPAHDAALTGDTLKSISMNREWRKFIVGSIESYLANRASDDLTLDNQELLIAFMNDLYD